MKVDIRTKIVDEDDDIYVVRPGEDYSFYHRFRQSNCVFLDFPDLDIPLEDKMPSRETSRLKVVRSLAIKKWYENEQFGDRPSDDIKDFAGEDFRMRLGRYVGAIQKLYFELPKGTVVVVPGPTVFSDVLIGELTGNTIISHWRDVYDGENIIIRRVRWVRSMPRHNFSDNLRARLTRPDPVMQLDRSLREEVLRAGFDQFSFGSKFSARINTSKEEFSTIDEFSIQEFVNYVTGILIASQLGKTEKVSFSAAIGYVRANPELAMDLKLNINSPGFQRLLAKSAMPLAAVALLTMANSDASTNNSVEAVDSIDVVNSTSANDDCVIDVAKRVASARDLMYLEDWERLCREMHQVRESTGLSTTMELKGDD